MDKKDLREQEIRTRYITPAILNAGWALSQVREEHYITAGQIHPRGNRAKRGERKFADYVLYHHNHPLSIIEAKDNNHSLGSGMQQALSYAEMWDAPFAYSSNGDGFLEHDRTVTCALGERAVIERALPLDQFPSPDFATRAEAQACFDHCWALGYGDVHQLDGDNDGIACESLP